MSQSDNNRRYESRQRGKGFVRGPRVRGDAAERLRDLAYRHKLTPCEVVSRLLLDEPLGSDTRRTTENPHGLSPAELQHAREIGLA